MTDLETAATVAIDCGFRIHKEIGPGLLEAVYEAILADSLLRQGLTVERQKPIPIIFGGVRLIEAFRADLIVEGSLVIETNQLSAMPRGTASSS